MSEQQRSSVAERKPSRALNRAGRVLAGTLAISLAVGGMAGCNKPKNTDGGKNTTTSAAAEPSLLSDMREANVKSLEGRYKDLQDYWASKGVKVDSELVILTGDKTFDCETAPVLTAFTLQSMTCREENGRKALVIPAGNYNTVAAAVHSTQTATDYILPHEYGHAVADTVSNGNPPGGVAGELAADCYSGAALAHINRSGATAVKNYIRLHYDDPNHVAAKALQAYDAGFDARNPLEACSGDRMVALAAR